jgi:hypothetical protein
LAEALHRCQKERDRLSDELSEWKDAAKTAQDEVCTAGEVHCTCVPLLRSEIKRLRDKLQTTKEGSDIWESEVKYLRELIPQAWDAGAEYEEDQSCSVRNRVGVPAKEDWMKQKGLA